MVIQLDLYLSEYERLSALDDNVVPLNLSSFAPLPWIRRLVQPQEVESLKLRSFHAKGQGMPSGTRKPLTCAVHRLRIPFVKTLRSAVWHLLNQN
jgi:hypothetical protein